MESLTQEPKYVASINKFSAFLHRANIKTNKIKKKTNYTKSPEEDAVYIEEQVDYVVLEVRQNGAV